MNQHQIQEAYLKNFCENGRLWAFDKKSRVVSLKAASQCTVEENFQSNFLESLQNDTIESPGIRSLRKLFDGKHISLTEYDMVKYWIALHTLRNKKYREIIGDKYESDFNKLIEIEKMFSEYFRYCYIYKSSNEKFFITSDNPIIEFTVGNELARILTLSPDKLLLFSHIDDTISHNEIEFTELINSMLWANCYGQVFSNKKELPIDKYESNIVRFNLNAILEVNQFIVKNKI